MQFELWSDFQMQEENITYTLRWIQILQHTPLTGIHLISLIMIGIEYYEFYVLHT